MSATNMSATIDRPFSLREAAESNPGQQERDAALDRLMRERFAPQDKALEQSSKLEFGSDLKSAISAAKETGKPIVLYLASDKCPWCDAMDKQLSDPSLKRMQDKAIFLKLNVTDDPHSPGRVMYDTLGAKGFPTTSVFNVDRNGQIKESLRLNGYYSSSDVSRKMGEVLPSNQTLLAQRETGTRNG